MKKTQWLKHGDHPAVRRPKESHLQPVPGLKNCGILPTCDGHVVVREGDWLLTNEAGQTSLLAADAEDREAP